MNEIKRLKTALLNDPGAESTSKSFGVLIPIMETPHGLSVLFEVRARNLRRQPGVLGLLKDCDYSFSSDEVAEVFTVPLTFFLETQPERYNVAMRSVPVEGFPYDRIEGGKTYAWDSSYRSIYFYKYDGRNIWGLTAGIINDFIEKLRRGGYFKK